MNFSGKDESIECQDCKGTFSFTTKDQEFYTRQGFNTPPKRCKPCRDKRKEGRNGGGGGNGGGVDYDKTQPADNGGNYDAPWREERRGRGRR